MAAFLRYYIKEILILLLASAVFAAVKKATPVLVTSDESSNAVSIVQFIIISFSLLLITISLATRKKNILVILSTGCLILFILGSYFYSSYNSEKEICNCNYFSKKVLIGTELIDSSFSRLSCEYLLSKGGGDVASIWTKDSIMDCNSRLMTLFISSAGLLLTSIITFAYIILSLVLKKTIPVPTNFPKMTKVFISHSSKDLAYVTEIVDLIEVIGLKPSQIFCSSMEGYGVPLGEDFLERLKIELNEQVLVLFVLTKNFYNSPVCLCEMGATWIKTNSQIPILIPPFTYSDIKGVFPTIQGLKINDPMQLNSLKEKIEHNFKLQVLHSTVWERKRSKFLDKINLYLQ